MESVLTVARRSSGIGPAARAAGVAVDVREHTLRPEYPAFESRTPDRPDGDVRASSTSAS